MIPADILRDEPLAPRTTLGLGGAAEYFLQAGEARQLAAAIQWARDQDLPVQVLGGGSNTIVPDEGVPGLTVSLAAELAAPAREVWTVGGGVIWDELVAAAVGAELAGIECLSGIPGRVGAVPIQNVGAYGQDVSETISEIQVLDLETLETETIAAAKLDFGYRDSALKRAILRGERRKLVTSVTFRLEVGGAPARRYGPLQQLPETATLVEMREHVVALRRQKSMVVDTDDPDSRSAGSFFTNPIVARAVADAIVEAGLITGHLERPGEMPAWPQPDGRVKLAAAWLIEHAGFPRGTRHGNVGQSSKHALALINLGGATADELLQYAAEIQRAVEKNFDVTLEREPRVLGRDG